MIIKHKIDAFLYAIFPQTKGLSAAELERFFVEYYSSGIYKPSITIDEQVKKIAFEFAAVGETGINIEKEDYTIPLIPNKTFTGKQFLSWLYVAWALAVPEHLDKMGLKFEKEFEVARSIIK